MTLDQEMYEAIGEVTVGAASLDYHLVCLAAISLDEGDEWVQERLRSGGKMRAAVNALCDRVGRHSKLGRDLSRLRQDAFAVLNDRHALVHSVALTDLDQEGDGITWTFWHPRSDTEARIGAGQIREHAQDLATPSGRAVRLMSAVDEWRTASARPGGAP
jgi:hypothetical protein